MPDDSSSMEIIECFESKLAMYVGRRYSLATSSCTAALDSAMYAVGIRPGTRVLVPGFCPAYVLMPILHFGGIPVFCDVNPLTLTILPDSIQESISDNAVAILAIHLAGHPADMDPIMEIALQNNLIVIEDCAQALGATYKGRKVGSIGHISCFSFQSSKNLPAGEGGALVTDDLTLYDKAALVGQHPVRLETILDGSLISRYITTGLGWNYRIHPFAAIIAGVGLDYIDEMNRVRQENAAWFNEVVGEIPGLLPTYVAQDCTHVYNMHTLFYEASSMNLSIESFVLKARSKGINIDTYPDPPIEALRRATDLFPHYNADSSIGRFIFPQSPELPGVWQAWEQALFLGPMGTVNLDRQAVNAAFVKLRSLDR